MTTQPRVFTKDDDGQLTPVGGPLEVGDRVMLGSVEAIVTLAPEGGWSVVLSTGDPFDEEIGT